MPTQEMIIAADTSLSIHERIVRIKGKDKKISSPEEAKAILQISSKEISWFENKDELPFAQMEAMNYLKYGDANLMDYISAAGKYIKNKGNVAFKRIATYFGNEEKPIQHKEQ